MLAPHCDNDRYTTSVLFAVHDPVCRHTPLTSGIDAAATPSKRSAASNMHFQFDDVARSFFFPRQRGS